MTLAENIKQALRAIRANLLRTVLTFLIIAFGIMALVGILTSIDSIKSTLSTNFASMGSTTFNIIRSGTGVQGGRRGQRQVAGNSIRYREAISFKEQYDFPAKVSVSAMGTTGAVVKYEKEETNPNIAVFGIDVNYLSVAGYNLEVGRNFSGLEVEYGRNLALVGSAVAEKLFPDEPIQNVLGKSISIRNIRFTIIGVLEEKGSSMTFSGDRQVFIPLMTLRKYFGSQTNSYNLSVMVNQSTDMEAGIAAAEGIMRRVRRIERGREPDFEIQQSNNLIKILDENTATIQLAAIFIGLVTLLGAAVGLMNIMLVSVTERTREIGICKSLGATRKNIRTQFLVEAIVICQIGGLLGVGLGIVVGNIVTFAMGGEFIVPWIWMFLGISLCFIVGLASGLYPAMKAARLDPIESLRHE